MKISATIIALNEEEKIETAISSARNVADEVVVVIDSRSIDATYDRAKSIGAKVFLREFDDYASQKNFAQEKTTGDWIISLDADEEIPQELAQEIRRETEKTDNVAFLIPRRNLLLGREIKYTRWSPDKHVWLWKRGSGQWVGKIHEELVAKGKIGELRNAKIHHSYETVSDFITMVNSYTDIEAGEKITKKEYFSLFHFFCDPIFTFLLRFIYKKGFLDGWQGFVLSFLMATYKMSIWVKVWEKTR